MAVFSFTNAHRAEFSPNRRQQSLVHKSKTSTTRMIENWTTRDIDRQRAARRQNTDREQLQKVDKYISGCPCGKVTVRRKTIRNWFPVQTRGSAVRGGIQCLNKVLDGARHPGLRAESQIV